MNRKRSQIVDINFARSGKSAGMTTSSIKLEVVGLLFRIWEAEIFVL